MVGNRQVATFASLESAAGALLCPRPEATTDGTAPRERWIALPTMLMMVVTTVASGSAAGDAQTTK